MTAVISGLNTPPIRRLKRTWEQVNAKFMSQLKVCESTIDTNKNFNNYRQTLARIQPPCVPFIGPFACLHLALNSADFVVSRCLSYHPDVHQ